MKIMLFFLALSMLSFSTEGQAAISRTEFQSVISKLSKIYKPVAKEQRASLTIYGSWESEILNAVAQPNGNSKIWEIYVFGGLARKPHLNKDGFAIIICHELGHYLGGYPKYDERDANWSSIEGQADYFATLKCSRKLFEKDDNEAIVKNLTVPAIVSNKCSKSFTNQNDINICIRSAMAAKNMTVTLESARGNAIVDDSINSFEATAPALNRITISTKHPGTQCRLDTLFQASLCDKSSDLPLSNTEDTSGICSKANGDTNGLRPECWYKID